MSYHSLYDIKRDRLPYTSGGQVWIRPTWAPEITNSFYKNIKKSGVFAASAGLVSESVRHITQTFQAINMVYEYPKNSLQWSIYIKEIFKTPLFLTSLRKRLVYSVVQHSLDAGLKVSVFSYVWSGTHSPFSYSDWNTFKMMGASAIAGLMCGWTNYSLEVARRTYNADIQWPEELRKGYRSPLHALLTIPFKEGPYFLFKGGFPHYLGNSVGFFAVMYNYIFLKDKTAWLWRYNEINYNFLKFIILSFSFSFHIMGQPFFVMKDLYDTLPRARGGKHPFDSTADALRFYKLNFDKMSANLTIGFWRWFKEYGIILYATLWMADSVGMLDNFKADPNQWETTHYKIIGD